MTLKQNSTRSLKRMIVVKEKRFSIRGVMNVIFRNDTQKRRKNQIPEFMTIGGVYFDAACRGETSEPEESKPNSHQSLNTESTESSSSSSSWISSGNLDHNQGAPRLAKNFSLHRINPQNIYLSDSEVAGRIAVAARSLPKNNGCFVSNHIMINDERIRRTIAPLKRIPRLDEIAREQAKAMAAKGELFHSNPEQLCKTVQGCETGCRIGENVVKGANVFTIHKNMRKNLADLNNLLDRRFIAMGVGTSKGDDGTLYLCQIFRD